LALGCTSGAKTYAISGTVSGSVASGVTIALSGSSSLTATTDSAGAYSLTVSAGSYTLTPSLSGYSFSPTSATVTVSGADVSGNDFTSSASSTTAATTTTTTTTLGDTTSSSATYTSGGSYSSSAASVSKQGYEYTSTTQDVPAIKVAPGGSLTLTNSKATKSGATSSTENSGFYGFNSGVLASSSSSTSSYTSSSASSISMTNCTINTSATGANGAFAFGANASITLDHVTIATTGDSNSRGVDATYGGTVTISNSTISTQGGSCAALATDRYQGTSAPRIIATNCSGTTAGTGSPGIYCTGTFTVSGCTLKATGSEAACIEGLNSITLSDSNISGTKKWGVIIYQSMSGDSSTGTGTFTMTGGTLTNGYSSGPAFFVCNTDAVINLTGATIANSSDLLLVAGKASTATNYIGSVNSSWGTSGGVVDFNATSQSLSGKVIVCDSSSSVDLSLASSSYSGTFNSANIGSSNKLSLDASSTLTLTGDSYVNTLTLAKGSVVNTAGYTLYYTALSDSGATINGTGSLKQRS
jgi:hypothetical protein